MLYQEALNIVNNNVILKKKHFPGVFGIELSGVLSRFNPPVILYSLEQEKDGLNQCVNVVRERTYFGRSDLSGFIYDLEKGYGIDEEMCFASREYAECVLETIESMLGKKVLYRGKEYFVLDWSSPLQVWLHDELLDDFLLSDLSACARLDELEFLGLVVD